MAEVHGDCDAKFEEVRDLFKKALESGEEVGASITVNLDGKDVVDIWGGHSDENRTRTWESDTIVAVWSSTKGVVSLALLMLIDRGLVDVNAKVAQYWPEFAANGKQDIEIRHLLSHTSGLAGWEAKVTLEDLVDHDNVAAKIAAQAPLWEPGTAIGYHAITFSVPISEIVRRVTGKTMKQFVAEEIAAPMKADFQIGLLDQDLPRVFNVLPPKVAPTMPDLPEDSIPAKVFTNPAPSPELVNMPAVRKADIGSINGHTNSRAMNRIFSAISLGGEANGVRLLSQKTIDLIFQEQFEGIDLVIGKPLSFGTGYALGGRGIGDFLPTGRVAFWGGWGGSIFIVDSDRRLTITYAMNQMSSELVGNKSGISYVKAVYKALGV